jgi:ribosomal protein S27AE
MKEAIAKKYFCPDCINSFIIIFINTEPIVKYCPNCAYKDIIEEHFDNEEC